MTFQGLKNQIWCSFSYPILTHSREYSGGLISPETSRPGLVDPKVIWTPSIAPSGLAFYNGDRFPQWRGNLFAGGLVSQDIRRIELDEGGNVIAQHSIPIFLVKLSYSNKYLSQSKLK